MMLLFLVAQVVVARRLNAVTVVEIFKRGPMSRHLPFNVPCEQTSTSAQIEWIFFLLLHSPYLQEQRPREQNSELRKAQVRPDTCRRHKPSNR
jgi:hypothetical protein